MLKSNEQSNDTIKTAENKKLHNKSNNENNYDNTNKNKKKGKLYELSMQNIRLASKR